jgi:hypothetical protein
MTLFISGMSGPAAGADAIVMQARRHLLPQTASTGEAELMVEGCTTAYEIASALTDGGMIDIDALIASGRLPLALRAWLDRLLASLAAAGLVKRNDGQWHVITDPLMPGATVVVQDMAGKQSDRAAELLLAAAIAGLAKRVALSRAITAPPESILSANVFDFYDAASVSTQESSDVIGQLLENEALPEIAWHTRPQAQGMPSAVNPSTDATPAGHTVKTVPYCTGQHC